MALNVVSSDRLSTNVKSSTLATALSGKVGSSKNLIINGAMQVAQRGATSTSEGYHTVDRWYNAVNGEDEAATQAQIALTSSDTGPWAKGFRNAYQITNGNQTGGAGAADYSVFVQRLEAQNLTSSGWDYTSASSYISISFWVKSSVAQNFYGRFQTVDGTVQNYTFETGALSANTWTKVTKKIPGNANITIDNNNDKGLELTFVQFYGTDRTGTRPLDAWAAYASATRTPDMTSTWWTTNDATFAVTGVQLEVGDTATEFEHISYGDELVRCQRYCQRVYLRAYSATAQALSDSTCTCPIYLETEMRGEPTITLPNTTSQNAAGKIAFTNHTGSWPATHGTLSGTYVTTSKFNVDGTGFTSSSFGAAGNAIELYASSNADGTRPYILCEAEL